MRLRKRLVRVHIARIAAALAAVAAAASLAMPTITGQGGRGTGVVRLDSPKDMEMKITDSFTLASVGDLIIMRPTSQLADPAFQSAIKIIKDADFAVGNFEANAGDLLHFQGPMRGFMGTKETPADVKAMGFDLVNRANNHATESSELGMLATNELLEEAGLAYVGSGKNLEDARAARFVDTPKGRVGMIGMTTLGFNPQANAAASYRIGNTGGKPGVNGVNLTRYEVVSAEQMAALKKVRDAVYQHRTEYANAVEPVSANEPSDRLDLFGQRYKVGDRPGAYAYDMNQEDLRDILRSVRNGKQYADFMIATIHTHDLNSSLVKAHHGEEPPDFVIELAHKAIDNGADAWVGHGMHLLRGIEIYKGKPIFYGLAEFFRQMDWTIYPARPDGDMTEAELAARNWGPLIGSAINYDSVLTQSRYDKGRLQEIRLYPIVGGFDGPVSKRGIPKVATGNDARRILEKLQALSKPFGTTIAVEGGVGVIRAASSSTTSSRE
jgi:poly-gamma-glutamate capsule biosynthesis protein CapA/YwtB (metallophosphatase superfamily)